MCGLRATALLCNSKIISTFVKALRMRSYDKDDIIARALETDL